MDTHEQLECLQGGGDGSTCASEWKLAGLLSHLLLSPVAEDCSEVFWLQVVPPLLEIKSILALFNRNLLLLFIIPE